MGSSIKTKREQIIESALILFAERGFHGTNVPAIANLANVGTGTIYRYFKNKEELVNAVYQIYVKKLLETISSDYPSHASTYVQFKHIIENLILFAKENRKAFIFIETHNHANYIDDSSKLVMQELETFLADFIKKGHRDFQLRNNLSGEVLVSIVHGAFVAIFKRMEAGTIKESREMLDGFFEACWDAIKFSEN